jgi:sorbitol/mannitol transport system permease protein
MRPLAARTIAAWIVTLLVFFPLGWLVLTAFKTELQAIHVPPLFVFEPTLANFAEVQQRSDYLLYAKNSLITSVASTLLGLAIAAPAAYSMAFFRSRRTRDILMWMLSTKMMPAVGALVPVYVMAQTAGLLDTRLALVVVFTLSNLPIMVWMLYSNFKDIPPEILEAARMDGAGLWQEFRQVLLPLAMGGIAATGLLCLGAELERGVLVAQPHVGQGGHAGRADRLVLEPRRAVLGQAVRRLADGDRADRRVRLVQPEAAGARA